MQLRRRHKTPFNATPFLTLVQYFVLRKTLPRAGFTPKDSVRLAMILLGWRETLNVVCSRKPARVCEKITNYYAADMIMTLLSSYPWFLRGMRLLHHSFTLYLVHLDPAFVAPLLWTVMVASAFASYPTSVMSYVRPDRDYLALDGAKLAAYGTVRPFVSLVATRELARRYAPTPRYGIGVVCVCLLHVVNALETSHAYEDFKYTLAQKRSRVSEK